MISFSANGNGDFYPFFFALKTPAKLDSTSFVYKEGDSGES